jgi:hypothetical protein
MTRTNRIASSSADVSVENNNHNLAGYSAQIPRKDDDFMITIELEIFLQTEGYILALF